MSGGTSSTATGAGVSCVALGTAREVGLQGPVELGDPLTVGRWYIKVVVGLRRDEAFGLLCLTSVRGVKLSQLVYTSV